MESTVVDVFLANWQQDQHRPLYICAEPPATTMTRDDVGRAALAVAKQLRQQGAHKGDRALLIYPPDSSQFPIALWGCLFAGVVAVPVVPANPLGKGEDVATLARIASSCGARFALTNHRYRRLVKAGTLARFTRRLMRSVSEPWPEVIWITTDKLRANRSRSNLAEEVRLDIRPDDLAYLQFTSGSTGHPKGVAVTHENLLKNLNLIGRDTKYVESDIIVSWVPWFHDMGLVGGFLSVGYQGCQYVFYSPLTFLKDPTTWLDAVNHWRATLIAAPSFGYDVAARRTRKEASKGYDLSCVRIAVVGGEVCRSSTMQAFADRFAENGFDRSAFRNSYGMAEAVVYISGLSAPPEIMSFDRKALESGRAIAVEKAAAVARGVDVVETVSVGRSLALDGSGMQIIANGKRCAEGHVGEIWICGGSTRNFYYGLPDETQETFSAQLDDDETQYLRTGDLGFHYQGYTYICGRQKDMIIVGGRNIYPIDVEDSVRNCHRMIRPGGVAAFSDGAIDGRRERVALMVEVRDPEASQEILQDVIARLRQRVLERHKLQCAAILLVAPGEVPKTSSGKVRRNRCRQMFAAGEIRSLAERQFDDVSPAPPQHRDSAILEPSTPEIEAWIMAWLHQVLGIPTQAIEPSSDFLELGCDSLAMVDLQFQLGSALGVELESDLAYQYTTPVTLARAAEKAVVQVQPSSARQAAQQAIWKEVIAAPALAAGSTLTPREKRWLGRQGEAGSDHTVVLNAFVPWNDRVDPQRLRRAAQAMVDQNSPLRTAYFQDEEGRYEVLDSVEALVTEHDLRDLALPDVRSRLDEIVNEVSGDPISAGRAPLLHVHLFRLGQAEDMVWLRVHHLIADGASLNMYVDALESAYNGGSRTESVPMRGFAVWLQRYLESDVGKRRLAEVRDRLSRIPEEAWLPYANTAKLQKGAPLIRTTSLHSRRQFDQVFALAQQTGVTVAHVMLAAFSLMLRHRFRKEGIVIQGAANYRYLPFLRHLAGDLANDYAIFFDGSVEVSFADYVAAVSQLELRARDDADIPWDLAGREAAGFVFQFNRFVPSKSGRTWKPALATTPEQRPLLAWREGIMAVLAVGLFDDVWGMSLTASVAVFPENEAQTFLSDYLKQLDSLANG